MQLTPKALRKLILEVLNEGWAITKSTRLPSQASGAGSLKKPTYMDTPEKAGKAYEAVKKGVKLEGWDLYAQLVAEAYKAAPKENPEGLKGYDIFKDHILSLYPKVSSTYDVSFVDKQPYDTGEEMGQKVKDTGDLEISTQFLQSDDEEERMLNLKNRAVHDYFGHLKARGHEKQGVNANFTLLGEIKSFNNQAKMIPPEGVPFLFSILVGQAAHYNYYGYFPEFKATTLDDFNPFRLGEVKGYKITKDNNLEKTNETD